MLTLLVAVLSPSIAATGSGSPLAVAVSCGNQTSADIAAGGSLTATFGVPATGLATVTFSTCRTAVDTVLTVDGTEYDDSSLCGTSNERVAIQVAHRPPGTTISIAVRFYDRQRSGMLQLDVQCGTLTPTGTPTTTAPHYRGGHLCADRCADRCADTG